MIILAFDSTELTSTACLTDGSRLLGQTTVSVGNTHSETLLPMIDHLLRVAGLTYGDLELLACSAGPGSFTGVRIGAATLKGLAFGRDLPCIGVSALEALAYPLADLNGLICPVMDARRSQFYHALFRAENGVLTRLSPDRAVACSDLAAELAARNEPFYLCGGGEPLLREAVKDLPGFRPTPELLKRQNAYGVALSALRALETGLDPAKATDRELAPVYLRPSQAERMRQGS